MENTEEMKEPGISDVIVEVLDVAINMILYMRNIYPDGIFQKCYKYNITVMMNKHPEVSKYIQDVLGTLKDLIDKGTVEKLIIQITNKEDDPLEKFCFEMKQIVLDSKPCYFQLETHLRALLLKITTCESMLTPLPPDCSFQILAYTNQSMLHRMEEQQNFQNFPWIIAEIQSKEARTDDSLIIPIRSCSTDAFVMQCYVEEEISKKKNALKSQEKSNSS